MNRLKRHRLLIFEAMGKRFVFITSLALSALLAIIALDWYQPFLDDWRTIVIGITVLATILIGAYLLLLSLPSVSVQKDFISVRGAFTSFRIPIQNVVGVTPSKISKHYPVANLRLGEFYRISSLYEAPCVLLEVKSYPLSASTRRYWFPRVMFTPPDERPGVLLNVSDWLALSREVEMMRDHWLERARDEQRNSSDVSQRFHTAVAQAQNNTDITTPIGQPDAPLLLLIDDSPAQASEVQKLFANNLRLLTTSDGIDGLRLARQHKPHLIIMDINLARLSGREFILTLRKHKQLHDVPILLMANENERKQAADILLAGANDYVLRPFVPAELKYRVSSWLAQRERENGLRHHNELLRTKTLNQMAELVRQGELVNFLPATVAQEVMSGQISGKSETFRRQKVTVLFVDIVGFTDLTGRLDPKLLAELLNEYLREVTAVSITHNGTVDKFIGDAVMVLFGAPQEQEEQEQAWAAINAGLNILKTVEHLNFIWESRIPRRIQVRIGINTGYCTTGVFGNEMLQSYTAVGSAVNIASRLQTAAEPDSLLCSRATFEYIQDRVYYREIGPLSLKGVSHAVEGYQILDIVTAPTPATTTTN